MIQAEMFIEQEENIFKKEYLQETSSNTGNNTGEYVNRNGFLAMRISPGPFWFGDVDQSRSHLGTHFKANTQYKFDIWIDVDSVVYDNVNREAGIVCYYTDNTSSNLVITGNQSTPIGWQHLILYSNTNKSIKGIGIYYWTNQPAYYRYDSMIIPMTTDTEIGKKSMTSGQFRETIEDGIEKGGIVSAKELMEI